MSLNIVECGCGQKFRVSSNDPGKASKIACPNCGGSFGHSDEGIIPDSVAQILADTGRALDLDDIPNGALPLSAIEGVLKRDFPTVTYTFVDSEVL